MVNLIMDTAAKKKLHQIKKYGCHGDPFNAQYQEIMKQFGKLAKEMHNMNDMTFTRDNFQLAILLMDCCIKIYKQQVELTKRDVLFCAKKIAERRSAEKQKGKETSDAVLDAELDSRKCKRKDSRKDKNVESENEETRDSGVGSMTASAVGVGADSVEPNLDGGTGVLESEMNSDLGPDSTDALIECITLSDDDEEQPVPLVELLPTTVSEENASVETDLEARPPSPPSPTAVPEQDSDVVTLAFDTITSILDNSVARGPLGSKISTGDVEAVPRKRAKVDYGDAPILISCYDEKPSQEFDEAPELIREARLKLRRKRMYDPVAKEKEQVCSESDLAGAPITKPAVPSTSSSHILSEIVDNNTSDTPSDINTSNNIPLTTAVPPVINAIVPESTFLPAVAVKVEPGDDGYSDNGLPDFQETVNGSTALEDLTPEDEVQLEDYIKRLHYLAFSNDLSKEELTENFESNLKAVEDICRQHNICIQRRMSMSQSTCEPSTPAQSSQSVDGLQEATGSTTTVGIESANPSLPAEATAHELFSDRVQERILDGKFSGPRIMEMVKEKNRGDSYRVMQEVIREKQKHIVSKYTNIPLIAENTKEFFTRVRTFENRMVKVLEAEDQKECFDVRKYEMEILDFTHSEIELQEQVELSEDEIEVVDLSPHQSPTREIAMNKDVTTVASAVNKSQYPQFNFAGLPSPSSSCDSNGKRWISLTKIFSHMKKLHPQEAVRMFYAVLALLSFENLDVKYDDQYGVDLDVASDSPGDLELSLDSRHARGLKIVSSKGLDLNTDDVHVRLLSSKLRTESFKESLEQDSTSTGILSPPPQEHTEVPTAYRSCLFTPRTRPDQLCGQLKVQIYPEPPSGKKRRNSKMGNEKLMNDLLKTVVCKRRRMLCGKESSAEKRS